jgi:hypothetical protein
LRVERCALVVLDDKSRQLREALLMQTLLSRWTPRRMALDVGSAVSMVLAAGLSGCGQSEAPPIVSVYEVKGKVLLAGGKPLSGGHVYFVPKDGATTSDAKIGPDGTFSLTTGNSGEGAPPGEYKVRIEPDDPTLLAIGGPTKRGKRLPFPARYLDEDGSGLTAKVEPKNNQLDPFVLK